MADFFDTVQNHERTWGTQSYPERPKLQEMLEAPVVVFWQDERYKDKTVCTTHKDTMALETYCRASSGMHWQSLAQ